MAVSISMIVIKASILDVGFASKSKSAKYFAVKAFLDTSGYNWSVPKNIKTYIFLAS